MPDTQDAEAIRKRMLAGIAAVGKQPLHVPPSANAAAPSPEPIHKSVAIDHLPPEEQARIRAAMAAHPAMGGQIPPQPPITVTRPVFHPAAGGIRDDLGIFGPANPIPADFGAEPPPPANPSPPPITPLPAAAPQSQAPQPEAAPAPAPAVEEPAATGITPPPHCPECGHDMDDDTTPAGPIDDDDKLAYTAAFLATESLFSKAYPIFDGMGEMVFRDLTMAESDAISAALAKRIYNNEFLSAFDIEENRVKYRMCLQLVSVQVGDRKIVLPAGLDRETNASAATLWSTTLKWEENEIRLDDVVKRVMAHVLRAESAVQAAAFLCRRFNRLIRRLAIRIPDANFYKATGQPA